MRRRRKPQQRKDTHPPKVILDYSLCAKTKDDEQNTFELKTTNHLCVLRGSNADPLLQKYPKNNVCHELEKAMTCPASTQKHRELGIINHRILSCAVTCLLPNGERNGPASKVFPGPQVNFSRGAFKQGKRFGHWENGNWVCANCQKTTTAVLNFNAKGELDGPQWQWKRGILRGKQVYKKGKKNSQDTFSQKGVLKRRSSFENSRVVEMKTWRPGGVEQTIFDNEGSQFTTYNHAGDITSIGRYGLIGGKHQRWLKSGVWKSFFESDIVKSIHTYDDEGKRHGAFRRYDISGALIDSGTYSHGKKVGRWVSFYFKDSPKFIENYDDKGVPKGRFCRWDNEGELIRCSVIRAGTGTFYKYSSEPRENYEMIPLMNNKTHGKKIRFFKGEISSESHWRNGERHGLSATYGSYFRRERFQNGKRDGESCHASDYRVYFGDYCQDERCGVWTLQRKKETQKTIFNASGKKLKTETYPTPKNATFECPLR